MWGFAILDFNLLPSKKAMAIFMLSLIKETTKKGISIKKINCDEFRRNADTKRILIHTLLNCKL